MSKVLSWTCPVCGKVITSLFERQLNQNQKAHLDSHDFAKQAAELLDSSVQKSPG